LETILSVDEGHKLEYEAFCGVQGLRTVVKLSPNIIIFIPMAAARGKFAAKASNSPIHDSFIATQRRKSNHTHESILI
jgi:hypothetical protein